MRAECPTDAAVRDTSATPGGHVRHTGCRWLLLAALMALTACADPWVEAQAAQRAGDWEAALAHCEQVPTTHEFYVEAHDLLPEVRFQAGRTAYEDGRWRQSIDRLRRLREHEPRFGEAQDLIGSSLYRMGEAAYATGNYTEAARLATMVRQQCSHFEAARSLATRAREKGEG